MRFARSIWLAAALPLFSCASPTPPPNPQASAAQAPANTKLATRPTTGQELVAAARTDIVIPFPPGSARITPAAEQQLDLAARLFRDVGPVRMFTAGYSDASGDEYGNLILSAKRAEATKVALVARGIPANRLLIQAFGASELADRSDPANPANRRVVITWQIL